MPTPIPPNQNPTPAPGSTSRTPSGTNTGSVGQPSAGPHPDQLAEIEQLLEHFERIEAQFQQVREGLTHSHRLATLGTIASIIAHEYNNILTPMINYCKIALGDPNDDAMIRKALQKSLDGAERAANISSSLLGFAREADEKHVSRLPQAIDDTLACLARDPKRDGIELNVDVPDVLVSISHLNLQQVLLNLMLNARKAMLQKGGSIRIAADVKGSLVHLTIADTGPGIPEAIMDRLFEPFVTHRTDSNEARDDKHGTGLGLCICRELIRNAGGSITATSAPAPATGATFHITLPKADELFDSQ